MADIKQIKLGKLARKVDRRTLPFRALLARELPEIPEVYDFDTNRTIPTPMFLNDQIGDCVIAGRAHQTLRFELLEQNRLVPIADDDVKNEYFKQSGGADEGLVMLDSLKQWRKYGWVLDGEEYTIHAFTRVTPTNHMHVKASIFLLGGNYAGLELPISAQGQMERGEAWDVADGADGEPCSWGGHCSYVNGYNATGPVCVTWGAKQQMTWAFWDKYCSESYALVDEADHWLAVPGIDLTALDAYLAALEN